MHFCHSTFPPAFAESCAFNEYVSSKVFFLMFFAGFITSDEV